MITPAIATGGDYHRPCRVRASAEPEPVQEGPPQEDEPLKEGVEQTPDPFKPIE